MPTPLTATDSCHSAGLIVPSIVGGLLIFGMPNVGTLSAGFSAGLSAARDALDARIANATNATNRVHFTGRSPCASLNRLQPCPRRALCGRHPHRPAAHPQAIDL